MAEYGYTVMVVSSAQRPEVLWSNDELLDEVRLSGMTVQVSVNPDRRDGFITVEAREWEYHKESAPGGKSCYWYGDEHGWPYRRSVIGVWLWARRAQVVREML